MSDTFKFVSLLIDLQRKNGANEYAAIIALVKMRCYHFFVRADHFPVYQVVSQMIDGNIRMIAT